MTENRLFIHFVGNVKRSCVQACHFWPVNRKSIPKWKIMGDIKARLWIIRMLKLLVKCEKKARLAHVKSGVKRKEENVCTWTQRDTHTTRDPCLFVAHVNWFVSLLFIQLCVWAPIKYYIISRFIYSYVPLYRHLIRKSTPMSLHLSSPPPLTAIDLTIAMDKSFYFVFVFYSISFSLSKTNNNSIYLFDMFEFLLILFILYIYFS